ncbi:MAG: hypothetical protein IKK41_02775 [Oscillospiraceae bacterium]|nr:hypothetical protein [Oscillospiraceae bacterium]
MCHKNVLWGCLFVAFGLGMLVGLCLEGGFFCHVFSLILIAAGGCICKRR